MESDNLKQIWSGIDQKLDRNWKLNLDIIRNIKLKNAKSRMTTLLWIKGITLAFYIFFAILFIQFSISHRAVIYQAAAGIILAVWTIAICIASVHELLIITQIDYSASIPVLQKKLIGLKLVIIKYFRLAVWILPLNFAFIILLFNLVFGIDIVAIGDKTWIMSNVILSIFVFIPLSLWLHNKLVPKNAGTKWMNSLLRGNGSQITDALNFLAEIEDFEKADEGEMLPNS